MKRSRTEGFCNQTLPRGEGFQIRPHRLEPRKCKNPQCKVVFQPQQPRHVYHHPQCQIDHANAKKLAREKAARNG